MENQFNQPQRQSKIGIIALFADSVQKYARAFLPLVFIMILKPDRLNGLYITLGILVILLIVVVIAFLRYLNFTFYIDDQRDEFVIHEGILNKSRTTIQLNKIQQVNISQNLIQRIINVYTLDVDTAGSDKKEGNIKAISHSLALALKSKLLENEAKETTTEFTDIVDPKTKFNVPFLKIDLVSLFKIGITSNYVKTIGLLLTFFFTIYDGLSQAGKTDVISSENVDHLVENKPVIYVILMFVLILFTVVFILNIGRTIIKFFGYTVAKQKGSLVLSYGLINTKSTLLKPEKVQITRVTRNYFQKKLNVLEIVIKQTIGRTDKENNNVIEIPGCNSLEADEILKLLFKEIPQEGETMKPNFRKLVFSIFLLIVIPLSVFYAIGHFANEKVFEYVSFAIFYALAVLLLLFFGFRNYRLFVDDNYIIKQSGAWDIDKEIIQLEKIQALTTSQLFWHKNLNIGSLTLHTAGGNVSFYLGRFDRINQLVNLWLYKIEKKNSNWM
ncbi:PH domain-containing protein [Flavobacterium capsici]|uniref:PH domain-containing protein n=1 Tax=Flavobacterium capsici TaxID=3075618 RepID=A0AA96J1N4_9FLAO|nr:MULTISPECIES: PH domain-containing protein [unclassified Flavobacterium]WNM18552.1 PH domain-containing protein [Flavobacterium sp. PMR2A8]WNM22603.1 PH domain-containing protein [Flavobacterium sp. PMTSA4]